MIDLKAKNLRDNVIASNQIFFIVYLAIAVTLGAGQTLAAAEDPQCLAEIDKVGSELWVGMQIYDRSFGRGCGTCHDVAPNPNLFESVKTLTFEEFDTVLRQGRNAMPKAIDAILAVTEVQTAGYDDMQAIEAIFNYLQCQAGGSAPAPVEECTLDTDGNANVDALTDGLLVIRHMFGIRGDSLVKDAVGIGCAQCSASDIEAFLDQCTATNTWDIDGNGEIDALTDGLLTIRYIFGIRQEALISNSVANDCTRCTVAEVEVYLQELLP